MTVNLLHTLCAEITLCNHFHLYLGRLDGVSFAYHGAERAVSREVGIACHEQVAQIATVNDIALYRMYHLQESRHLLYGIGHQYSLEIVSELETVADTGGNGVNVLQHAGILDTDDIGRSLGLDEITGEDVCKCLCFIPVGTSYRQIA